MGIARLTTFGSLIVDVLDSLILFGMDDEYERAKSWVADLSFAVDDWFHVFEARFCAAHSKRAKADW